MTLDEAMRFGADDKLSDAPDAYSALTTYLAGQTPVVNDRLGDRPSISGSQVYSSVRLLQAAVRAIRTYRKELRPAARG